MPKKSSTDLFLLVKSLTHQEWETLWRIQYAGSWKLPKSDKLPLKYQFVLFLKEMDQYDEEKVKSHFNVTDSPQRLKKLKIRAEELIQEVIERTRENLTEITYAQKLPTLLDQYLIRGATERAGRLVEKYSKVVKDLELFEIESQLLDFKQRIYSIKNGESFNEEAEEIAARRIEIFQWLEEVAALRRLREEYRLAINLEYKGRKSKTNQIVSSEWMKKSPGTQTGKILQLDIQRQIAIETKDLQGFKNRLIELEKVSNGFLTPAHSFELLQIQVHSIYYLAILDLREGNFEGGNKRIGILRGMANGGHKDRGDIIQGKVLALELYGSRRQLDTEKYLEIGSQAWNYLMGKGLPLVTKNAFHIAYLASEIGFILGEYTKASKWLNLIRSSKSDLASRNFIAMAYFLSLFVRVEETDFHGVEYLLKQTNSYVKKNFSENILCQVLLTFFKAIAKHGGTPSEKSIFELHWQKIQTVFDMQENQGFLNFFPFYEYFEAKINHRSMIELISDSNRSRFSF